jgi:hypothetical protein
MDIVSFPEEAVAMASDEPNIDIANCAANIFAILYPYL